jgi:phenylacetate-coenzyme A ligase PaaK-like adenylate-forming protein
MNEITPEAIFSIDNPLEFEEIALEIFRHQAIKVPVYKEFVNYLAINPNAVERIEDIPFLPVEFFKSHLVTDFNIKNTETVFSSSGTTGSIQSKHVLSDLSFYEQSFNKAFELFYGNIEHYVVIALLPSYLERSGSSLVYMCDHLIKNSKDERSGFYLNEYEKIKNIIIENDGLKKVLLIGVTYALLDFAEQFPFEMEHCIVMETGGMKGKRKEMLREEVHQTLCNAFHLTNIHSEYGMTELLSQAYSNGNGIFRTPPWMKIMIRETQDPFSYLKSERTGGINIIDLANLHSCSFIATQDLGKIYADERFEVIGRFDNADMRGCNLLVQ